ncbi:MAG: nucleotide exchange factor GrpE [Rhodospirillaceae bacterium]|nr:nucleotide exchange factor GrpE [Rhodospirillaceae bacterium]|tara:strand:+ start:345 stop:965 length:621 start_codon:yes stop_codon:yes gene_type:complete
MTNENQVKNEEMGSVDLEEQKIDEENLNAKETNAEDGVAESDDSLNNKVIELKDQLLRSVAELDNYRKRVDREKEQLRKFGIANFAKELLAVADNLRRALESGPSELAGADEKVKNLIVGVEMTEKELLGAFEKNGVRQINPLGEKFDYNFHQAMFEVEAEDKEPGIVVQVLQPGYAIEDRILRAAMVGVSKSRGADQPEGLDEKA